MGSSATLTATSSLDRRSSRARSGRVSGCAGENGMNVGHTGSKDLSARTCPRITVVERCCREPLCRRTPYRAPIPTRQDARATRHARSFGWPCQRRLIRIPDACRPRRKPVEDDAPAVLAGGGLELRLTGHPLRTGPRPDVSSRGAAAWRRRAIRVCLPAVARRHDEDVRRAPHVARTHVACATPGRSYP
jgi:hypothetical protein